MYKVLIIDDEPVVRKGMANVIRWRDMGCEVIGEACNGLEGKQVILDKKPDIILTDIHMPEMNGLQMIRETLSEVPHAQIIVLTGYRDFDYIQEALRLGAADYILKPSKLDAIVACVKKAIHVLDEKQKRNDNYEKLEALFKQARPALLEKRLRDIAFKVSPVDERLIEEMRLFGFELGTYYMLLIELSDIHDAYSLQLNKLGLRKAFIETFEEELEITPFDIGQARMVFILQKKPDVEASIFSDLEGLVDQIDQFMVMTKEVFAIEFDSAISTLGQGFGDVSKRTGECIRTIEYKHYIGKGAILLAQDFESEDYDDIGVLFGYKEPLMNAIKVGNIESLKDLLEQLKMAYEKTYCLNPFELKDFLVRLNYDVHNFVLIHLDQNPEAFEMDAILIQKMFTERRAVEKLYATLVLWSEKVACDRNEALNNNIDSLIVEAISYIVKHYSENIALKDVAGHVNISTYYLSRLFKRETGKNFSEYLVDYRIKKAKTLLGSSELKLYEIAEQVGIPDPHYFSRAFKKHEGLTPTQYRESVL